jgi:cell division septation protein DedD
MRRFFSRRAPEGAPSRFPRRDDERYTEADIQTILRAGSQGVLPDELCATEGIKLETYEAWKAKYSGLSLSQIKIRRRRERRNRWTTFAAAGLVAIATGGWYVLTRADTLRQLPQTSVTRARAPIVASPRPVSAPVPAVPKPSPQPAEGASANPPRIDVSRPIDPSAKATDAVVRETEAAEPSGYSVQVAAAPSPEQAQDMIRQLSRGGHVAYLSHTVAKDTVLYRVRVGPFESRDEAQAVVKRLEVEGYRGAWIAK